MINSSICHKFKYKNVELYYIVTITVLSQKQPFIIYIYNMVQEYIIY